MSYPRSQHLILVLLILTLGFFIYANTFNASFHYDDADYIVNNAAIKDLSDIPRIWKALVYPARFFSFTTFALNYHFHQLHVTGYHVVNWAIHILTALCVYWMAHLILSTPRAGLSHGSRRFPTVIAALLFLTHPVQTQAVTYICQRFASLASLFYVLAVCLYFKGRLSASIKLRGAFFLGSGLSAVLAMFSKETALTLPFAVVLCEGMFLRQEPLSRLWVKRSFWMALIILISFAAIIPVIYKLDIKGILTMETHSGSHRGEIVNSWTYLLTQARVLVVYLRLLLFPIGQNLLYDFPLSSILLELKTGAAFLLLAVIFAGGVFIRGKYPVAAFAIFWFFLTLSVESSVITISHVIFEHRLYLPLAGVCVGAGWCLSKLFENKKYAAAAASIIIAVLAFLTYSRNNVWKDDITLWQDVARKSPRDERAFNNLGLAYAKNGNHAEAIEQFDAALRLNPSNALLYCNRGNVYRLEEKWTQALADFDRAVAIHAHFAEALNNRGLVYLRTGREDEALRDFDQAIHSDPFYAEAYTNRGMYYSKRQETAAALADYNKALQLNPHFPQALNNRGNLYRAQGDYERALADYNQAIEIDLSYGRAYNNRGTIYYAQGDYAAAMRDFEKAITLDADYSLALLNKGNLHMALKQPDEALAEYEAAILLDAGNMDAYFHQGKALTNLKKFNQALLPYNKILQLNPHSAQAYYDRARIYSALGKNAEALDDMRQAERLGWNVKAQEITSTQHLKGENP